MKSQNAFLATMLLLTALGIGGCSLDLAQEEGPATGQNNPESQEQEARG